MLKPSLMLPLVMLPILILCLGELVSPTINQELRVVNTQLTTSRKMEACRAKGLCYWCPEKYVIGHRFHGKQFFIIEIVSGEYNGDEQNPETITDSEVEHEIKKEVPEISLHAISDTMICSTMKIEGRVNNRTLQLLINSSSTYSFLDVSIADKLGQPTKYVPPLRVLVANGNEMI